MFSKNSNWSDTMNNLAQMTNQIKQLLQNQPANASIQQVLQDIETLNNASNQSPDQQREQVAKLEAAIQSSIDNMNGTGSESIADALNQLQVELMNWSQQIEHQNLNQTATKEIPGQPLNMDKDPAPPSLLS